MEIEPTPSSTPEKGSSSCLEMALFLIMAVWVTAATLVSQSVTWVIEQSIFEGSTQPDLRWLVTLIYALAVLVPALVIWAAGSKLAHRRFYLAFGLAAVYVLLLAPARLAGITAAFGAGLLQIAGGLAFWLLTLRLGRTVGARREEESRREEDSRRGSASWAGLGAALAAVGLVGLPWLAWGAFGSPWDILLNLAAALLFGAGAARVLEIIFHGGGGSRPSTLPLLWAAFAAALALLVMVTGLGVNGSAGLLALAVPGLGLALAALYRPAEDSGGSNRPVLPNRPTLALLAGLAAFWPLALIDPDELAQIISLGAGELIQWANTAAGVGLVIGLLVGVAFLLLRSRIVQPRSPLAWGAVGLVWLAGLGLYLFVGQPGLYGERLFVILKEQADLSGAPQMADYPARRAFVYNRLVETADSSQAGLRQVFDRLGMAYQPYYLENAIEVQAGPLVRAWLNTRPEVDRVLDSPVMRPLPAPVPPSSGGNSAPSGTPWNLTMIGADRVWKELGVTGEGIVVGQSDTGVQGDHPELAAAYRGGPTAAENDYNWFDPWYGSRSPVDISGHGTHTLGTVLGRTTGVAPGAQWIGCVNLARNLGNPALYLDCMQFHLAPFPLGGDPLHDGDPARGAHVLNNSWGCPPVEGCDARSLQTAVESLRAAGVFVVASAGNEGSYDECSTLSDPIALYDAAFSVGAVDESGELAPFSSVGPVLADGSGRTKPDIIAPGVDVLSAYPGSSYSTASGTSMAGPHLVGVVALMWSANPALIGDIERTEQILDETAAPYTGSLPGCTAPGQPNSAAGYGLVDAYAAVSRALEK